MIFLNLLEFRRNVSVILLVRVQGFEADRGVTRREGVGGEKEEEGETAKIKIVRGKNFLEIFFIIDTEII